MNPLSHLCCCGNQTLFSKHDLCRTSWHLLCLGKSMNQIRVTEGLRMGPGRQMGDNMVPMRHVMASWPIRGQNHWHRVGQTLCIWLRDISDNSAPLWWMFAHMVRVQQLRNDWCTPPPSAFLHACSHGMWSRLFIFHLRTQVQLYPLFFILTLIFILRFKYIFKVSFSPEVIIV